jgi:hypothetical protein
MSEHLRKIELVLNRPIVFNDRTYLSAHIDLDHINFGLKPGTKELKSQRRSNFTEHEIGIFLLELDAIDAVPIKVDEEFSYYSLILECPVLGMHLGKRCKIVLKASHKNLSFLSILTIYRVKK